MVIISCYTSAFIEAIYAEFMVKFLIEIFVSSTANQVISRTTCETRCDWRVVWSVIHSLPMMSTRSHIVAHVSCSEQIPEGNCCTSAKEKNKKCLHTKSLLVLFIFSL